MAGPGSLREEEFSLVGLNLLLKHHLEIAQLNLRKHKLDKTVKTLGNQVHEVNGPGSGPRKGSKQHNCGIHTIQES